MFITMKKQFYIYFLVIFVFSSCNNQRQESNEMNSFLEANYEFNNRYLNRLIGSYNQIIKEQPSRRVEKLNELNLKFELLISQINIAIANKESNLEKIDSESKELLNDIPKIVDNNKDYLLPELNEELETKNNELKLKYIKNRLTIALAYTFEYATRKTVVADGYSVIKVDSIFLKTDENGIRLTLTSKHGQTLKDNIHILINKIEFNGKEKRVNYKLNDNYSFADIVFDSLPKGKYRINGFLRLYERGGKIDIPFEKDFKSE